MTLDEMAALSDADVLRWLKALGVSPGVDGSGCAVMEPDLFYDGDERYPTRMQWAVDQFIPRLAAIDDAWPLSDETWRAFLAEFRLQMESRRAVARGRQ